MFSAMRRMSTAFARHGHGWCVIVSAPKLVIDILVVQSSDESSPLQRQASFNWGFSKSGQSPTKTNTGESPHPSPQRLEHDLSRSNGPPSATLSPSSSQMLHSGGEGNTTPKAFGPSPSGSSTQLSASGSGHPSKSQPHRQESSDNLKSFKVSLEDPAWKVLPAALKKYKINNDDWQNYAMFICYGSAGQCLRFSVWAAANPSGQGTALRGV